MFNRLFNSSRDRVPGSLGLFFDRCQDHTTNLFNGVFWEPPEEESEIRGSCPGFWVDVLRKTARNHVFLVGLEKIS